MNPRLLILSIFLFKAGTGVTQTPLSGSDSIIAEKAASSNIKAKSASPFGTGSLSNFFSSVSVSSFFKEGVNGKIEFQGKFNSRWSGGVTIDQKIGETDNEASPLDLTGISPGTTIEFNLQKMFWHPSFILTDQQIQTLNIAERAYAVRKGIKDPRTVSLRDISQDGTEEEEKKLAFDTYSKASNKEPVFINARIGFTKTSFSYATDSFTLAQVDDAFITPNFTFSVIKTLGSGFDVKGYIALSYNYCQSYTAADDVTFTIPFGTTPNYYTNTLTFGKPGKVTSNNIIAEYRRNIFLENQHRKFLNLAISPSVTLDISNKMMGIFLPAYFIKGSDDDGKALNGLQGGIRVGYITSTASGKFTSFANGFTAQLIISEPLDFLGSL